VPYLRQHVQVLVPEMSACTVKDIYSIFSDKTALFMSYQELVSRLQKDQNVTTVYQYTVKKMITLTIYELVDSIALLDH